jgi:transmembrane sensor
MRKCVLISTGVVFPVTIYQEPIMDEQRFIELASRYVAGVASSDEVDLINSLIAEQRYADILRGVHDTWILAGKAHSGTDYNTELGLNRLAERLRKHEPVFRWGPNRRRFQQPIKRSAYIAMAASIATVLIIIGIQLYETNKADRRALLAWNVMITRMGEKIVLSLPDGTTITLNADSKLRYPVQFDDGSRDVYLEGEAYFDVKHDATRAFIVHTGGMTTLDLGTKFNISAFLADSTITVSLDEGSVDISYKGPGATANRVVLSPSKQFVFNRNSCSSRITRFDPRKTSGWKDGFFTFDNEPLSVVFTTMERAFGVKFELADTALARRLIKAEFRNETAWTVAEILKKAAGLTCTPITDHNSLKKFVFSKN